MDGVRLRYEQTCADCGGSEFVEDRGQGDLVCTSCGLVAESHVIDESSEWRNFGDKDGDTADPSRVGGPTNHLLSNGGLSTVIGAPTKGAVNATMTRNLQRAHAQGSNPDQSLLRAFGHISRLGDALGLNRACKDRANELFKNTWEKRGIRGKGVAAVCAAVTLIACRQVGFPRTFKEMEAVVADGSIKDIKRCYRLITKQMDEKMEMVTPADYVRRFCSHLGLTQRDMKAAEEMAEAAVPRTPAAAGVTDARARLWDGKSPVSVAAGVIYTICLLPQASKAVSPGDIAQAAGVAEGTVRNTYRDLYADVATLVPAWFLDAQRLDLRRLPQPHSAAAPV